MAHLIFQNLFYFYLVQHYRSEDALNLPITDKLQHTYRSLNAIQSNYY